jgi:hypothetical protein
VAHYKLFLQTLDHLLFPQRRVKKHISLLAHIHGLRLLA